MTQTLKAPDILTLADVKQHLVVEHDLDDVLIQSYIDASLSMSELYLSHPVTQEDYQSAKSETDSYNIIYAPSTINVTLLGVDVDFSYDYQYPFLTIVCEDYDLVDVTVQGDSSTSVIQARKIQIGSWYNRREDEMYFTKTQAQGVKMLFDLNQGSIL